MARYVKVSDGEVLSYPYTPDMLRSDHPQTSFPGSIPSNIMEEFGAAEVLITPPPATGPYEMVQEATPVFQNGAWRQGWAVVSLPVPSSITPRQCRLVLMAQGLLSQVETMIAAQDEATRITWEYALEFRRDDPLLVQLAKNLNLSPQQLDEFFFAASQF